MTNELLCYRCLVENVGPVAAVTVKNGTAMCEKCARALEEEWQTTKRHQFEHDNEVLRRVIDTLSSRAPGA